MRNITRVAMRQILIVLLFISFCQIVAAEEVAIDIIPASIEADNLLIGGYREILVNVYTDSDDGFLVTPLAEGYAKEWITFSANRMEVSKTSPLALKVMIELPMNVAEGLYPATLNLEFTNNIPLMFGNTLTKSVDIVIDATKNEISDVVVENVEVYGSEQGSLIDIAVNITNKGNVAKDIVVNAYLGRQVFSFLLKLNPMQNLEKILNIDSFGMAMGEHNIAVEVVEEGDLISVNNYQLLIVASGQLSSQLELIEIEAPRIVYEGDEVHLDSYVRNAGDLAAYAVLRTQIIKDSTVIETIESKRIYIPYGKERGIPMGFAISEEGEYLIDNVIYYGDEKTASMPFALEVLSEGARVQPLAFTIFPILVMMIIVLVVVAIRYSYGKKDWSRRM